MNNTEPEPFNALAHLEAAWGKFLDDPEPSVEGSPS